MQPLRPDISIADPHHSFIERPSDEAYPSSQVYTRDTYSEQKKDNDLCRVVAARGTMAFVRGKIGQILVTSESVGIGDAAAQAEQAVTIIAMLPKEAGAELDHACRITIDLTDLRFRKAVHRVVGRSLKPIIRFRQGLSSACSPGMAG